MIRAIVVRALFALGLASLAIAPARAVVDPAARGLAVQARAAASSAASAIATQQAGMPGRFALALQGVTDNLADAFVVETGDSTGMGRGAGGTAVGPGTDAARTASVLAATAARLRALGYRINTDAWFGLAGAGSIAEYNSYNPQVQFGTGWAAGGDGFGGAIPQKASASAGAMTDTPLGDYNAFDIYTPQDSSFSGSLSCSIDGGTATTIAENGATSSVVKTTLTAASGGVHTLSCDTTSGATTYLLGVVPRRTTTKQAIFVNAGVRAWTTAKWVQADKPWRPLPMLQLLAPIATIIPLGINDYRDGGTTPLATSLANIDTLVTTARLSGEAIIRAPNDIAPADDTGPTTGAAFRAALQGYAAARNILYLDPVAILGGYAAVNSAGNMYDVLHPTGVYYAKLGAWQAGILDTAARARGFAPIADTIADPFTDADATLVTAHTAPGGYGWTIVSTGSFTIANNQLYADTVSSNAAAVSSFFPPADQYVEADILWTTVIANQGLFAVLRRIGSNRYICGWRGSATGWQIDKDIGGTVTVLAGTTAFSPAAGTVRHIRCEAKTVIVSGAQTTTLRLLIDGAQILAVNDNSLPGAGQIGLAHYNTASTTTTGGRFDNLAGGGL